MFQELVFIQLLGLHYRSPIMQLDMGEHIEDKPILVWRNPPDDRSNALQSSFIVCVQTLRAPPEREAFQFKTSGSKKTLKKTCNLFVQSVMR